MSNAITLRRTLRQTKDAVKDNENAHAKPRLKVLSKPTGDTAPTFTSHLKLLPVRSAVPPMGKRKREVLTEVTAVSNNRRKRKDSGSGMFKEKDGEGRTLKAMAIADIPVREPPCMSVPLGGQKQLKNMCGTSESSQLTVLAANLITGDVRNPSKPSRLSMPKVFCKPQSKTVNDTGVEQVSKRHQKENMASDFQDDSLTEVEKIVIQLEDIEPDVLHAEMTKIEFDLSQIEAERVAAELIDVGNESEEPVVSQKVEANNQRLWNDLDAEDSDDPVMVSEYVAEVCLYLKDIEVSTLPNPDYMSRHPELDWVKRGILVDWILQVHARFNLVQETLFLCTNILDRFLSARTVSLARFQLVGITAFFIAAKFEETYTPSVFEIARLADNMYSVDDILKAERYILKTIGWDLRYPGPLSWLRRGSKADDCEIKARTVGKYLIEIGCVESRLVGTVPSLLAAGAMWLARLVLGRDVWTPNLEHYMTYTEEELLPTSNIMLEYILEPIQHECLYKKYAHKRYLKCSAFIRRWALERWPENSKVDLNGDLPALKEDIRVEREMKVDPTGQ